MMSIEVFECQGSERFEPELDEKALRRRFCAACFFVVNLSPATTLIFMRIPQHTLPFN